jgi:hypothetical protein
VGIKEIVIIMIILAIGYWLGTNDALAKFTG